MPECQFLWENVGVFDMIGRATVVIVGVGVIPHLIVSRIARAVLEPDPAAQAQARITALMDDAEQEIYAIQQREVEAIFEQFGSPSPRP